MHRIAWLFAGFAVVLAWCSPNSVFAQVTIPLEKQELGHPAFECAFSHHCAQNGTCDQTSFIIAIYRDEDKRPFTFGFKQNKLIELRGQDDVSFVEKQWNGSVSVTTLFRDGTATHARHTYTIKGTALQYYGSCKASEKVF